MEGAVLSEAPSIRAAHRDPHVWLLGPVFIYLAVAIPIGWLTRERFNSDGVCYLHRAILLAHGQLFDSISGYWSPGLSWSVVPLLWIGIDPLHAIHLALFTWGMAFVFAAQIFLRSIVTNQPRWIFAAGIPIALTAVRLSSPEITPDVVIGTLLLLYLCLAREHPGAGGLVAAIAYLGKAYALPFFLVHFLMTVIVRRLGWRSLLMGYLAFALVAGPWIGVLSWKYGRFTFSTAATRNRFMQDVAPPELRSHPPDVSRVPPGPFFTNMEVTDADAWPSWSPLDSHAHFLHQVHIAVEHVGRLIVDIWRFDYVGFALVACLLVLLSRDRDSLWLLLTGSIYVGGLLMVVYETRYVLPVLLPIALALCLRMCLRWGLQFWPFIIATCFGASAALGVHAAFELPHANLTDRKIARLIVNGGCGGLFATNTPNRDRASCVAFMLKQKFIALPPDLDPPILQSKLDADGVRFLYRWFDPLYADGPDWPEPQVRLLIADGNWTKKLTIHLDSKRRLDIYERNTGSVRPGTTAPTTGKR